MESFAFVKKPDETWAVGIGRATWRTERPKGRPGFYAPDFFLSDPKPWLCFEATEIWSDSRWQEEIGSRSEFAHVDPPEFQAPDLDSFLCRIQALLGSIDAGELDKAVPVEFETAATKKMEWLPFLSHLPRAPGLWPYGFWTDGEGMLGATPEILLQLQKDRLETMALAGTGRLEDPDLMMSPKELREHRWVIHDIVERLTGLGEVNIGETSERRLPSLKHLHTPIRMRLSEAVTPEELICRLHPTAALGGFPRNRAWSWLEVQPEAAFRRRFGAPFAYVEDDSVFAVVAIRNLQYHSGKLWLGAGCGVVHGSVPEREWNELQLKRDSVRHSLGLLP